jgi:hypothetical protein
MSDSVYGWRKMNIVRRKCVRDREIAEIKDKYFTSKIIIPDDDMYELMDISWQENRRSEGNPIGYVLVNNPSDPKKREFIFGYSKVGVEIATRKGFREIPAFPNLSQIYVSKGQLFPTFQTKLPSMARVDLLAKSDVVDPDLANVCSGVLTDDILLIPPAYYNRPKEYEHRRSLKKVNGQKRGTVAVYIDNSIKYAYKTVNFNQGLKGTNKKGHDFYGD